MTHRSPTILVCRDCVAPCTAGGPCPRRCMALPRCARRCRRRQHASSVACPAALARLDAGNKHHRACKHVHDGRAVFDEIAVPTSPPLAAFLACRPGQDAEETRQTLGRLKRMAGFEGQDFDPLVRAKVLPRFHAGCQAFSMSSAAAACATPLPPGGVPWCSEPCVCAVRGACPTPALVAPPPFASIGSLQFLSEPCRRTTCSGRWQYTGPSMTMQLRVRRTGLQAPPMPSAVMPA